MPYNLDHCLLFPFAKLNSSAIPYTVILLRCCIMGRRLPLRLIVFTETEGTLTECTVTANDIARHFEVWFRIEFSISLIDRTIYHQYFYAMESNIVPEDKQFPLTFFPLQCTSVRDKQCATSKRFYIDCGIPSERYWSTTNSTICASLEEAIATLCDERDSW